MPFDWGIQVMRTAKDDDSGNPLSYAPRWLRDRASPGEAADQARNADDDCADDPAGPAADGPHDPDDGSADPATAGRRAGPSRTSNVIMFEGDRELRNLRLRMALEPDLVPEPPAEADRISFASISARVLGVVIAAAVVAFVVVVLTGRQPGRSDDAAVAPSAVPAVAQETARTAAAAVAGTAKAAPVEANTTSDPTRFDFNSRYGAGDGTRAGWTAPNKPQPEERPVATAPSQAERAAPRQDGGAAKVSLSRDQVDSLLVRGRQSLDNGDIASARLMFQRAAEVGDSQAAFLLGSTYDPLVLKHLGVIGAAPDLAKARTWYQQAVQLGSAEASRSLEQLAQAVR
jgi:hypothetical protein